MYDGNRQTHDGKGHDEQGIFTGCRYAGMILCVMIKMCIRDSINLLVCSIIHLKVTNSIGLRPF